MPSTVIRYFRYDEASKVLTITFVSGDKYRYMNVPPDVFVDFKKAYSKGQYFSGHIRDVYQYEKLEE